MSVCDHCGGDGCLLCNDTGRKQIAFADPGGKSALRSATPNNPRIHPCPTCEAPNRLTWQDVNLGYQCDECAIRAEGNY